MDIKEHYNNHLGNFYSWMVGDFDTKQKEFQHFLSSNAILPTTSQKAIDLGAGHGIQTVALANIGFTVTAIDFNTQLLNELKQNTSALKVEIIDDDIRNVKQFAHQDPELIICCGDTLSHLASKAEIEQFISDIYATLKKGGKMILSFRDYSTALIGDARFIPVKSDDTRILTCVLDYDKGTVHVTDLLNEKTENGWVQKISSYNKVRITTNDIVTLIEASGMKIELNEVLNRMTTIIATKP